AGPSRGPSAGHPRRRRSGPARESAIESSGRGQEARDGRPAPLLAVHVNGAAVLLEDLVADRESQAEAVILGGEERIEDPRAGGGRDAAALVDDGRLDHRARAATTEVHL